MANNLEYVELGLACADICKALERGVKGKELDDPDMSVREAIAQFTPWVAPVMHGLDSSLTILIAALWPRSRRKLSKVVDRMYSSDFSVRGVISVGSLLGG